MPSPIAHASIAFVLWPALARDAAAAPRWKRHALAGMLVAATLAPDVDFIPHFLYEGNELFGHGGPTHSLVAGVVAACFFALIGRTLVPASMLRLWIVGLLAWWLHVVMDFFTRGGGVMMLWPLSTERIGSPVPLFYGAEHSQPLAIHLHMITLANEVPFLILMWWLGRHISKRRKTPPLL